MQRLLAYLLHVANTSPPPVHRDEFYGLKERLLNKYARLVDFEFQEIAKECWGPWDYEGHNTGCKGAKCPRCGGTGIYSRKWFSLERWEWCGYIFHRPCRKLLSRPDYPVMIHGRIEHRDYGRAADEARLWLYILCGEWRLLWRDLRSHCACGWYWWPVLNVQRITMNAAMFLSWRQCWCGKWFPTWGKGWCVCRKCRKPKPVGGVEDIPF